MSNVVIFGMVFGSQTKNKDLNVSLPLGSLHHCLIVFVSSCLAQELLFSKEHRAVNCSGRVICL